ncbi:tRNA (uridine(54)-C5)-methyltransferase TrmA [Natronospirillum operosum]|uniref:tRNA/tmRNA (uracil-C(5))-methyltransferase n=1 Tax=Natronospirillum operosum TaxID=2759953 RepID=A0A4Z0WFC6_9GAMM|nr:tRNA (uridine(54)-C5)-methyltransferase TrmA [Natronospirillum operosum]TGG95730.1 tRNA (uridine(54)-C5)-methyltransferase TrmA [Natronospirillum operosum]
MSDRPGQVYPDQYQAQLTAKSAQLRDEFAPFWTGEPEVHASPTAHFRMRAEFRVWHQGERTFFAMFDPANPREPIEMPDFPVGSERINELMEKLLEAIHAEPELRYRLFQAEFLTTLSGDALVTLIYHRKLDEQWDAVARPLAARLHIGLIGRSRKQRRVLTRDHVDEALTIDGRQWTFRQIENSFTQPNARVCEHMVTWACARAAEFPRGDLLELYCGLGTFTLPLSRHFNRVLATEISKVSVRAAQHNIEVNGIDNVVIGRMSAEDFSQGWRTGEGRRILDYDLPGYRFSTVFVDPPRAGLDADTVELVRQFERILYISCNPETLRANVEALQDTHELTHLALFDQFPYTHHREAGAVLQRRG